jgi:hypothetical protein
MERLRNASRWIAAVWLVSQLVAVVASTLILRAAATSIAVVAAVEHCECTGTDGACPMHPRAPAAPEHGECAMRNCSTPDAALVATATIPGVMPPVAVLHDGAPPRVLLVAPDLPVDRPDRPDLPPPRA